jgi:proteic killer suppression protein
MIDDAATDQDLRVPPSNHFEKLRGKLAGLYSIVSTINGGWSSGGTRPAGRPRASILTTIATDEANHANDET